MTRCGTCNGSGMTAGIYASHICHDCDGEGSWDDAPETCRICKTELNDGECPKCDAHLTDVEHLGPGRIAA
jgi:hypothetical protein